MINTLLGEHILPLPSNSNHRPYIGRFAPSPSGPLHFGSLVCALASFLHAKQAHGRWLVRIEDIDTPRVHQGMGKHILHTLQVHGLQWDDELIYQSQRQSCYQQVLDSLISAGSVYACQCSRKHIRARSPCYDRHCRHLHLHLDQHALRWKNDAQRTHFYDHHYGELSTDECVAIEDPVLKRADGIFTYHLAVVADDIQQNVTHVIRGSDLLDTTPLHISLFDALCQAAPCYFHIPVASETFGQKLSKQHHAPSLDNSKAIGNLKSALVFLGSNAQDFAHINDVSLLLDWAILHWQRQSLSSKMEILVSQKNGVYYSGD